MASATPTMLRASRNFCCRRLWKARYVTCQLPAVFLKVLRLATLTELRHSRPEQHEALSQLSVEQGKPVSLLVREAIEKTYFEQANLDRR